MAAGWVLAAMAIGAFVSGAQARHLAARLSPTKVVLLGLALEVAGVAALALLLSSTMPAWAVAVPLVVYGVGLGLASAQLTSTVLADVPPAQSGSGSATQSTARQVGSALGTALVGSHDEVAALIAEYAALGIDHFILSGYPRGRPRAHRRHPPGRHRRLSRRPRGQTHRCDRGLRRRPHRDGPCPGDDRTVRRPRPADRGRAGRGLRRRDSDRPGRRPRHAASRVGRSGRR